MTPEVRDLAERMSALARRSDGRPGRYADEADALHEEAWGALIQPSVGVVDPLRADLRALPTTELEARVAEGWSQSYAEVNLAGNEVVAALDAWRAAVREGRGEDALVAVLSMSAGRIWLAVALNCARAAGDILEVAPVPLAEAEPEDSIRELEEETREEWIDQPTAARFLGDTCERTVRRYHQETGFPQRRTRGKQVMYPVMALAAWAQSRDERILLNAQALPPAVAEALRARLRTAAEPVSEGQAFDEGLRKSRKR